MLRIGITGGIGAGKSTIAKIFECLGYPVFYSDAVAKQLMHTDLSLRASLVEHFGEETFLNGKLNRPFLSEIIMNNEDEKAKISALVHPRVREKFEDFVSENSSNEFVFNEAAIIFETGSYKKFDVVILVTASKEVRIERVRNRDGATTEQVIDRMNNQWTDDQKIPLADYLIENMNDTPVLEQVEALLVELKLNQSTSS
ncbi:MAG: dephospho-CoA kinase [Crocinitomicaceae bacterium]|nr:dephospho-CoA kinase [Crocinitomicaceae bacterium]